jgi:hypothetical protein
VDSNALRCDSAFLAKTITWRASAGSTIQREYSTTHAAGLACNHHEAASAPKTRPQLGLAVLSSGTSLSCLKISSPASPGLLANRSASHACRQMGVQASSCTVDFLKGVRSKAWDRIATSEQASDKIVLIL